MVGLGQRGRERQAEVRDVFALGADQVAVGEVAVLLAEVGVQGAAAGAAEDLALAVGGDRALAGQEVGVLPVGAELEAVAELAVAQARVQVGGAAQLAGQDPRLAVAVDDRAELVVDGPAHAVLHAVGEGGVDVSRARVQEHLAGRRGGQHVRDTVGVVVGAAEDLVELAPAGTDPDAVAVRGVGPGAAVARVQVQRAVVGAGQQVGVAVAGHVARGDQLVVRVPAAAGPRHAGRADRGPGLGQGQRAVDRQRQQFRVPVVVEVAGREEVLEVVLGVGLRDVELLVGGRGLRLLQEGGAADVAVEQVVRTVVVHVEPRRDGLADRGRGGCVGAALQLLLRLGAGLGRGRRQDTVAAHVDLRQRALGRSLRRAVSRGGARQEHAGREGDGGGGRETAGALGAHERQEVSLLKKAGETGLKALAQGALKRSTLHRGLPLPPREVTEEYLRDGRVSSDFPGNFDHVQNLSPDMTVPGSQDPGTVGIRPRPQLLRRPTSCGFASRPSSPCQARFTRCAATSAFFGRRVSSHH
ncbi:hypothetical protein EES37_05385 [Streptomyces sp. ADI91-18]|nr:hypothetical protein EES37_05385 [Streptomyces sp. ADI91-18]